VPGSARHEMKPDRLIPYTRRGVRVTRFTSSPSSPESRPLVSLARLPRPWSAAAPDPASSPPPSLTADAAWPDLCCALFGSVALAQLRAHLETLTTVPQRRRQLRSAAVHFPRNRSAAVLPRSRSADASSTAQAAQRTSPNPKVCKSALVRSNRSFAFVLFPKR
jgi:hypothetical protein